MCLSNNCTVFLQVRKLKEKSVTYRLETQDHMIEYKCRTESKVKILWRGFIVILPHAPFLMIPHTPPLISSPLHFSLPVSFLQMRVLESNIRKAETEIFRLDGLVEKIRLVSIARDG